MKILFKYMRPYKWLVALVLLLAAINIGFSLIDPIIFGKLVNLANYHQQVELSSGDYFFSKTQITNTAGKPDVLYGVVWLLVASITVAMVSRIAKAFQDYFLKLINKKFL